MNSKLKWVATALCIVAAMAVLVFVYDVQKERGITAVNPPNVSAAKTAGSVPNVSATKTAAPNNAGSAATVAPGSSANPSEPVAEEKIEAPDFTVFDKDKNSISLSDFKGKPVVINFFASWCPPCKEELPYFQRAFEEYGDEVVFMMVDLTDGVKEKQEDGQAYIDKNKFTFPLYFDLEQDASITYGLTSIPGTVFLDREGYVSTGYIGMVEEDVLLKDIGRILKK